VQERLRKASAHFSAQLQQGLTPWLAAFSFGTDNKALGKQLGQAVDDCSYGEIKMVQAQLARDRSAARSTP